MSISIAAQGILFEDSFEFEEDFAIIGIGEWTMQDIDLQNTGSILNTVFANSAVPRSFMVFNPTTTAPPITAVNAAQDWTAKTGNKHMVCFYTAGAAPLNNDWMISPQIALGTSNVVKFWAKACNFQYKDERFSVWISTTDTNIASFTKISAGNYITTPAITWAEYSYNLAATYNNLPVYIAIRCQSSDRFGFAVDDFSVTGTVLATDNFITNNFKIYPNPATNVINVAAKNATAINSVQVTDVNGRVVMSKDVNASAYAIDSSGLTSGVYFVKVSSDLGSGITKIVKQ